MDLSTRKFDVHMFWVSHGLLLLRSGMSGSAATRIDILFRDVVWMMLPVWMNGIEIQECPIEEIDTRLPERISREAILRRGFRITTEGTSCYVIAGNVETREDRGNYFQASLLLPDRTIGYTS